MPIFHTSFDLMKNAINLAIKNVSKINEIRIFRAMAKSLNEHHASAFFVKESHQCYVKYKSLSAGKLVQKEISDLVIVSCLDQSVRLCFLQAKYHKKHLEGKRFLDFEGDYFQWELLNHRPLIKNCGRKVVFPEDILSFTDYYSIGSFGVFYYDTESKIDMLYSVANLIIPKAVKSDPKRAKTTLCFPGTSSCPLTGYKNQCEREMFSTCDLSQFEKGLLLHKVGAPIPGNSNTARFIAGILCAAKDSSKNKGFNLMVDKLITLLNIDEPLPFKAHPNILLVELNKFISNMIQSLSTGSTRSEGF